MLIGHYAVGLLGKRIEPKLSLGTLVLAVMLPDLLWCVFLIAGTEHVRVKPGVPFTAGMRALDALEAPDIVYSHSLVMGAVWGALLAILYLSQRGNKRAAWVLFAAVLSHWVLDFASHPPDMPLSPGMDARVGLGLWNSIPATLAVEGAFWLLAIAIYLGGTGASSRAWAAVFWLPAGFLTLAWYNNITGPAPTDLSIVGYSSLIFFILTVLWAYWMNRLRPASGLFLEIRPVSANNEALNKESLR